MGVGWGGEAWGWMGHVGEVVALVVVVLVVVVQGACKDVDLRTGRR